ncbi:MAG: rRNA maturation RNase YbeY [Cyanophyceae cyanobacterium]
MPSPTAPVVTVNVQEQWPPACPQAKIAPSHWKTWIRIWLATLQRDLPSAEAYELSLCLTDDRDMQSLNAQYRGQDVPTDVLAFAALEVDVPQIFPQQAAEPLYLGDIVISVETAWQQAQQQEHALQVELAWLTAHGLLHLLGWDHPDENSLAAMLSQQETLLQQVSLCV